MSTVYEIITEKMIEALEAGFIPWRRPWNPEDAARNIRGTYYRGANKFLLEWARMKGGFGKNIWLTPKQAMEMGGNFKGQKTTQVIFWKIGTRKDAETGEEEKTFLLRYYNVLNVEQVTGIELPAKFTKEEKQNSPIECAEMTIQNMPNRPEIKTGGSEAYYAPSSDFVNMPDRNCFESSDMFYAVMFHELGHATGHKSRLGRHVENPPAPFGTADYSKEELVAEMTSAFVCGEIGLSPDFKNSAAYIQSWISVLKNEKQWLIQAAGKAQHAADYILNRKSAEEEDNE